MDYKKAAEEVNKLAAAMSKLRPQTSDIVVTKKGDLALWSSNGHFTAGTGNPIQGIKPIVPALIFVQRNWAKFLVWTR